MGKEKHFKFITTIISKTICLFCSHIYIRYYILIRIPNAFLKRTNKNDYSVRISKYGEVDLDE
jgi:hypothetical protein